MTTRENKALEDLYTKYLVSNNVTRFRTIDNHYALVDGIFQSGTTDVFFEYKQRFEPIEAHNHTTYLQEDKYESMVNAAKIINSTTFYIVEYANAILLYDVMQISKPMFKERLLPENNDGTGQKIYKQVADLSFYDADYILAKRNDVYIRRNKWNLLEYVTKERAK